MTDFTTQIGVSTTDIFTVLGVETPTEKQQTIADNCLLGVLGSIRKYLRYDPFYGEHTEFHPQQPFQAQIQRGIWEVMEQRATLRQVSEAATNEMQLQHIPVRSMVEVYVDYDGRSGSKIDSFGATTLKTEGQDYWANFNLYDATGNRVCMDGIIRTIGLWPTTPGTVKVVYNAGYTLDEFMGLDGTLDASPIRDVLLEESVRRTRRILAQQGKLGVQAGILSSENLGEYSYSLDSQSIARLFSGDLMGESKERLSEFVNFGYSIGS